MIHKWLILLIVASGALLISCGGTEAGDTSADEVVLYVADDVPRRSVAVVAAGPGRVRVGTVEELVIDVAPADPQFPNALAIAVGSGGRIFKFDTLADVWLGAFTPQGIAVGDWTSAKVVLESTPPGSLVTIGARHDGLVIAQLSPDPSEPGRLSTFASDGTYLRGVETAPGIVFPHPIRDERTVARELSTGVLSLVAEDGSVVGRFTVFKAPEQDRAGDIHLWPKEAFVVGGDRVYATASAIYEVAAFDLNADVVWVLEAPWPREPIPEHLVAKTTGRAERVGRTMAANLAEDADAIWPDYFPALAGIETDDQGRLFVFPYVVDADATEFPVDVYSPDGELVVNGILPFQGWDAHRGEHVFRVEQRAGRSVIVRYQLLLSAINGSTVSAGQ